MKHSTITLETNGEQFYEFTDKLKDWVENTLVNKSGLLTLIILHTSCALTINEAFDPSAKSDLEDYLKHIAPRDLKFIKHDAEGEDDSPSHMKSMLLNQNLVFAIDEGKLVLGRWQGIYLAEFRDAPHIRKVVLKFIEG